MIRNIFLTLFICFSASVLTSALQTDYTADGDTYVYSQEICKNYGSDDVSKMPKSSFRTLVLFTGVDMQNVTSANITFNVDYIHPGGGSVTIYPYTWFNEMRARWWDEDTDVVYYDDPLDSQWVPGTATEFTLDVTDALVAGDFYVSFMVVSEVGTVHVKTRETGSGAVLSVYQ